MYRVFINNKPLKKKTNSSNSSLNATNEIVLQLKVLQPGTEINIHTADQTYYNASFQSFDPKTGIVSLLIDQFYKDGGQVITVKSQDIVSIDLPASAHSDEEDE